MAGERGNPIGLMRNKTRVAFLAVRPEIIAKLQAGTYVSILFEEYGERLGVQYAGFWKLINRHITKKGLLSVESKPITAERTLAVPAPVLTGAPPTAEPPQGTADAAFSSETMADQPPAEKSWLEMSETERAADRDRRKALGPIQPVIVMTKT